MSYYTDQHNCASGGFMVDMPRAHSTDCVFVKIVARCAILANTTFHQMLASITAEAARSSPHSPKTAL